MKFTYEQRQVAYKKLDDKVQDFIVSNEVTELVRAIASKYQLSSDAGDALDSETYYTMLGLQSPSEMVVSLGVSLGLPEEKKRELVSDLKNQIFNQLEALKNGITKDTPNRFVQTPTSLKSTAPEVPSNLPTGGVTEEKILSSVGSPGEKLAWEQRKQIAANALPKVEEKKYVGIDPYREPLQ